MRLRVALDPQVEAVGGFLVGLDHAMHYVVCQSQHGTGKVQGPGHLQGLRCHLVAAGFSSMPRSSAADSASWNTQFGAHAKWRQGLSWALADKRCQRKHRG